MRETLTPEGIVFYDLRSARTMLFVTALNHPFNGWLCWLHPDGEWVTQRKATQDDRTRIEAANRDAIANAWNIGEDRYRASVLGQRPLREVALDTPTTAESHA